MFERKCGSDLILFFNGTEMSWCRTVFFKGCWNVLVPNCLVSGQIAPLQNRPHIYQNRPHINQNRPNITKNDDSYYYYYQGFIYRSSWQILLLLVLTTKKLQYRYLAGKQQYQFYSLWFTRSELKPTIYRTWREHVNHYTNISIQTPQWYKKYERYYALQLSNWFTSNNIKILISS